MIVSTNLFFILFVFQEINIVRETMPSATGECMLQLEGKLDNISPCINGMSAIKCIKEKQYWIVM